MRATTFPKLTEATARLDAKRAEVAKVFDEAGSERDMDKVTSISGDSAAKVDWIRQANAEMEDLKAEVDDLREIQKAAEASLEAGTGESGAESGEPSGSTGQVMSLGRQFVKSEAFQEFGNGRREVTATVEMDIQNTLFQTTAGWTPETTRTGVISAFPTRPAPHVVDFIPSLPTKQAAIKYMEETTFTNAAAEAAEGAAYGEAALVLTERSKPVEKVAVFLPVTDEQLEDEQQAAGYVDQRLTFMIRQRLDSQVLVGDGVTPNIVGTEGVVGIQAQPLGGDPIVDAIYKVFTSIRTDGFAEPTAVFIQAAKWQTVRLQKTADGIYIWGHPSAPGPDFVWGVPVVQTQAVSATKAVTGDYAMHSSLYVRRGVDVKVSDSHSDYFVKGKQAIRADLRVAMVHYRPKAFGEVTGL